MFAWSAVAAHRAGQADDQAAGQHRGGAQAADSEQKAKPGTEPSGGDDATMEVALQSAGLPGFVMMLANLVGARGRPSHDGEPELRVYLYEASAPRTAVLANMGNFTPKVFSQKSAISLLLLFSCAKSFDGKPSTLKPLAA